ncbi:MAG: DUF2167 domain-containing protein, partial [Myxococcales bacterium]
PGLKPGPQDVDLGESLVLAVPRGQGLIESKQAKEMLQKGGTKNTDGVLGIVVPFKDGSDWIVVIKYSGDGYVKDSEDLDAREIFDAIKEGTEELNAERAKQDLPQLFVDKWFEPPRYDRSKHHMIWGLQGHTNEDGDLINYNTHVLGRRGFVSLNLVTAPDVFAKDRAEAAPLLDRITFRPGDRYEDFKDGTDKVAEYGLAGLVLGGVGLGAAKLVKVGLLAKFGKVILVGLVAGKKFIVAAVIGLGALLKRWFGRKHDGPTPPAA